MNANELADKLGEIYTNTDYEEIEQAATMLRQQHAEIERLQKARCVACGWNPSLIGGLNWG